MKATFLTVEGDMCVDTQRKQLLQLMDCTGANPEPQETWGADPSRQAPIRTKHLFTGFLVSEPWQTLCIFMLLFCSGLLSLFSIFFFFNHKVSLYLLIFSKVQLPGVMRKCVRHCITRNGLVLYAGKKKGKPNRSWICSRAGE